MPLVKRARAALASIHHAYTLVHVRRQFNATADALANQAMDTQTSGSEFWPDMLMERPVPRTAPQPRPNNLPSLQHVAPPLTPRKRTGKSKRTKPRQLPATSTIRVGTANLRAETHLQGLMESLVRPRRLDIVGLTEVKRWYNEQLAADGYDYHAFHERMEAGDDFLRSRR